MRPLMIGEAEEREIVRVVAYAREHVISTQALYDIRDGQRAPPSEDEAFTCFIPVGFKCVFTLEQQPHFLARHLQVNVETEGHWPSREAVDTLAKEFGFQHPVASEKVIGYTEDETRTVNILEPVEFEAMVESAES